MKILRGKNKKLKSTVSEGSPTDIVLASLCKEFINTWLGLKIDSKERQYSSRESQYLLKMRMGTILYAYDKILNKIESNEIINEVEAYFNKKDKSI